MRFKLAAALTLLVGVCAGGFALLTAGGSSSDASSPLTAALSVLRRPRSPADALPAWAVPEVRSMGVGQRRVPDLTRLVATVPYPPGVPGAAQGRERIYLTVFTPGTAAKSFDRSFTTDGDRVAVAQLIPGHAGTFGGGGVPASLLASLFNAFPSVTEGYAVGIVPDGVARVDWTFGPRLVVRATVHNNVAVARVDLDLVQPTSTTWYGDFGRVIQTFERPIVPPAAPALSALPSARDNSLNTTASTVP